MSDAADRYRRAAKIFADAMDRTPGGRADFLDDACSDDAALRAEIDRMIAADERGGPVPGDPTIGVAMPLLEQRAERRVGDYEIIGVIGEGGMGVVYLARQDTPRRRVALKMIRRGASSRQLLRRFRHEAEILGQLHHPGIAHVYEAGMHDDGEGSQPYFAMEYVEGVSLTRYARERSLSIRARLELFARVCDAVHHAHQKGVIHRDLKPENILVTAAGDPKILDFGVARVTDGDLKATTIQTNVGQLIGTVAYMSPEQAAGDAREIDTRSDVYALGVILFELLAERRPHSWENASIPEMLRAIQEDDPTPLSTIDTRYRGDIDTIVAKAIEKEPARRYASAEALAADIRRYLDDEPIMARRASRVYRFRKFARRNRAVVIGLAATMIALVLGTIASLLFALHGLEQQRLAEANAAESDWQSYRLSIDGAVSRRAAGDHAQAWEILSDAPAEERDWEWSYVRSRLDRVVPEASVARPLEPAVAAFRPDGTPVAGVLLADGLVVFDLETGEEIVRIDLAAQARVRSLTMSDDGAWLVSRDETGATVWDARTGRRRATLAARPGNANAIAPDGQRVAWTDRGGMTIIDVATAAQQELDPPAAPSHGRASTHVRYSADGGRIAWSTSGGGTRRLLVTDARTGRVLVERSEPSEEHCGMPVWSASGARLAIRLPGEPTRILDAGSLDVLREIPLEPWAPGAYAFLDDDRLVQSEAEHRVTLVDFRDGSRRPLFVLPPDREVNGFEVDAAGRRLILHGPGWARMHDLEATDSLRLAGHTSYVYTDAWSADGALLATGSWDGTVRLWDGYTGEARAVLSTRHAGRADLPKALTFVDGGRGLEFVGFRRPGGAPFVRRTWDLLTGRETVSVEESDEAYLWEAPAGLRLEWGVERARSAAPRPGDFNVVSADGRTLARRTDDGVVVLDRATRAEHMRLTGIDPPIVGLSHDGARLVTGDTYGVLRLWDVTTGAQLAATAAHEGEIFSAVFGPGDRRIVTAGRDGVRVVSATTLDVLLHLDGHDDYVRSASFSPDGTRIASVSGDGDVRIWDARPAKERRMQAEAAAARRARVTPVVDRLLAELGDGGKVAESIAADPELDADERRVGRLVVIERVLAQAAAPAD